MTKVKLNLASGTIQEREVVTAFNFSGVKYIIFDGESTGSMGLPIILVSKESFGKAVGITDAEEWKNTKECLKKIIAGETIEYASIPRELKADDIYYRQLTLPIASFDTLKSAYKAPSNEESEDVSSANQTPIFEPISPEDIAINSTIQPEPVAPSTFNAAPVDPIVAPGVTPVPNVAETPIINPVPQNVSTPQAVSEPVQPVEPQVSVQNTPEEQNVNDTKYEEMKNEFMKSCEDLFNKMYEKLNR